MNVQNVQLTEKNIKDLFSATIYQRGRRYYTGGRVHHLHFNTSTNSWLAEVEGTETYIVSTRFKKRSVFYDCNCPAARQYAGPCKHVAAVLLKIYEYQEEGRTASQSGSAKPDRSATQPSSTRKTDLAQLHKQQAVTGQLIETFTRFQQKKHEREQIGQKQPLRVEWTLKQWRPSIYQPAWLALQMKVGRDRTYVVRKIGNFIESVINQVPYTFTNRFSFDPEQDGFADNDMAVIDLLSEQMKGEKAYRTAQYTYGSPMFSDERKVIILPIFFPALLNKLKTSTLYFDNDSGDDGQVAVHENTFPLTFRLDETPSGEFQLNLSNMTGADYLEQYGYIFKKNALYALPPDQKELIGELFSTVQRSQLSALPISEDQIEPFLSHAAPSLKRIGQLTIADKVSKRIAVYPLHAELLVDRQDDQLLVQLNYHYGDVTVNPFDQNESTDREERILIRDAEKEQGIMDTLESAALKFNGKQVYAEGEEAIYDFLFVTLPQLEERAEIRLTNPVKTLLMPEQRSPFVSIDLDSDENWLDVQFKMDGIEEQDIQKIIQSIVEKKRYYRLPNGAFVSLQDQEFQSAAQILDDLKISGKELQQNQLKLPLYRGGQIESIVGEKHSSVGFGKTFRRFLNRLKNPEAIEFDVPQSLHAKLRDYQFYGYQWLKTLGYYGLGGILADEMGLGKTPQSIAYLTSEKEMNPDVQPALIVAPASLTYNWKNELQKFAPDLQAVVLSGTVQERKLLFQQGQRPDIWITSYHTLRQDISLYENQTFSTLILDEAQTIKNFNTKTAKAVRQINARNRFALSGTPIENSIDELWSIFQTILPGFFPSLAAFKKIENEKIAKMIRPFLLRRLKKDVLAELPDKIETVQSSELTKEQKEIYLAYLRKIQKETKESLESEGFQKSRIKILGGLTRLRQICCHPALFVENYHGESGKLQQLRELVSTCLENGRRMLIFSQFTSMLAIIRQELEQEGLTFFYLDGKTPAKERVDLVDQFNRGENSIFLLSLKAGNTGLNLTGADTVILYDLWWNPAVEDQAVGRAHRIGQRQVVQVVRLITQGTIEEKIHKLQQNKKDLIETVVQPGDQSLTRLSEKEIREILSI
ncbi:MAG: DEAD/DEAH box helicase [Sporolactobacillus sp.]